MEESGEWSDFKVIPEFLINNLLSNEFITPFPVQSAVLSNFFSSDRDLAIGFPTGSGKTLSYLIPLISSLYTRTVPEFRQLIIVPNRELATQVFDVISILLPGCDLSASVLSTPLRFPSIDPHLKKRIHSKTKFTDIIITTPMALATYIIQTNPTFLSNVDTIVLDEGDLLLDQPIENWLHHVDLSLSSSVIPDHFLSPLSPVSLPNRRIRRILCSATLSRNSKQSEDFRMDSPILLVSSDRSRYVVPQGITEQFCVTSLPDKGATLLSISSQFHFVLAFVSSTKRCVSLGTFLRKIAYNDFEIVEFSASTTIAQKKKALENPTSKTKIIIATDSLARGVDLPFVDLVVNFDVPEATRTYIHRMGRTARGGATGTCITLLLEKELSLFKRVVEKIDGSAPEEIHTDISSYTGNDYYIESKKFDKKKLQYYNEKAKLESDSENDTDSVE